MDLNFTLSISQSAVNNEHCDPSPTDAHVASVSEASSSADFCNSILVIFLNEGLLLFSATKTPSC